jgi:predicted nucleotidyltransferase component of viral defense system
VKGAKPANLVASIHQRLLNHARKTRGEPQLVLMRYGLERLLYRLSQSEYAEQFVLKGAMLYLVWTGEQYRSTKDLDLLALQGNAPERWQKVFQELCRVTVVEDGLVFLPESVKVEEIRENQAYQGVRVKLQARLGNARIPLQVDIGFGDAVTPRARKGEFPTLLNLPAPKLSMYPKETVVAEKYETMVKLGLLNSRMRDYYDIWVLSREFEFEGEWLSEAIRATFQRRRTALGADTPFALSRDFARDAGKQRQWQAFVQKGRLKLKTTSLAAVVKDITEFLKPAVTAAVQEGAFKSHWPRGGPWQ